MFKKKRDYVLFLEDIMASIKKIERYTKNLNFEKLKDSEMAIDAIVLNFEVIGEAVKNVPASLKDKYHDVEWKEAAGFRDILVHDYFGIDLESVWDTLKNNIPAFKKKIAKILEIVSHEESPK